MHVTLGLEAFAIRGVRGSDLSCTKPVTTFPLGLEWIMTGHGVKCKYIVPSVQLNKNCTKIGNTNTRANSLTSREL
jgi:hypothetical protein